MGKLKIFGFRIDGIPKQLNFLFDGNKTIGEDVTMTHYLNSVLPIQYNTKSIYCRWLQFGNNRHKTTFYNSSVCVCACVRAGARVCVCVRACLRACVRVRVVNKPNYVYLNIILTELYTTFIGGEIL